MKIKDMPLDDRPREKIFFKGVTALSNTELIATIIGNGNKKENAIDLSRKVLKDFELHDLSRRNLLEICRIQGIGVAKASKIIAAFELGRRAATYTIDRQDMRDPELVARKFMPWMSKLNQEHLVALFLDTRLRLIKEETIFIGSLNSSVVHPREIFNAAIKYHAAATIIVHNHPSGDPEPSEEDIHFTKQVTGAGEIIGIEVVDHVIIGANKYFSMKGKDYF